MKDHERQFFFEEDFNTFIKMLYRVDGYITADEFLVHLTVIKMMVIFVFSSDQSTTMAWILSRTKSSNADVSEYL